MRDLFQVHPRLFPLDAPAPHWEQAGFGQEGRNAKENREEAPKKAALRQGEAAF